MPATPTNPKYLRHFSPLRTSSACTTLPDCWADCRPLPRRLLESHPTRRLRKAGTTDFADLALAGQREDGPSFAHVLRGGRMIERRKFKFRFEDRRGIFWDFEARAIAFQDIDAGSHSSVAIGLGPTRPELGHRHDFRQLAGDNVARADWQNRPIRRPARIRGIKGGSRTMPPKPRELAVPLDFDRVTRRLDSARDRLVGQQRQKQPLKCRNSDERRYGSFYSHAACLPAIPFAPADSRARRGH